MIEDCLRGESNVIFNSGIIRAICDIVLIISKLNVPSASFALHIIVKLSNCYCKAEPYQGLNIF